VSRSGEATPARRGDPATDQWTTIGPMLTGRNAQVVGVVAGKLYAIGGQATSAQNAVVATVEAYSP